MWEESRRVGTACRGTAECSAGYNTGMWVRKFYYSRVTHSNPPPPAVPV